MTSAIEKLPLELMENITCYLDNSDLKTLTLTSKSVQRMIDPTLFQIILLPNKNCCLFRKFDDNYKCTGSCDVGRVTRCIKTICLRNVRHAHDSEGQNLQTRNCFPQSLNIVIIDPIKRIFEWLPEFKRPGDTLSIEDVYGVETLLYLKSLHVLPFITSLSIILQESDNSKDINELLTQLPNCKELAISSDLEDFVLLEDTLKKLPHLHTLKLDGEHVLMGLPEPIKTLQLDHFNYDIAAKMGNITKFTLGSIFGDARGTPDSIKEQGRVMEAVNAPLLRTLRAQTFYFGLNHFSSLENLTSDGAVNVAIPNTVNKLRLLHYFNYREFRIPISVKILGIPLSSITNISWNRFVSVFGTIEQLDIYFTYNDMHEAMSLLNRLDLKLSTHVQIATRAPDYLAEDYFDRALLINTKEVLNKSFYISRFIW